LAILEPITFPIAISGCPFIAASKLTTNSGADVPNETTTIPTTRVDTLCGVSYVVLAPENPLVDKIVTENQKEAVESYKEEAKKQSDIEKHNTTRNVDQTDVPNGRQQTNIGIFRAYIKAYLAENPKIHKDMTFLVRQLAPTAKGLPIEIYVFSNDQVWANYEDIQADIFDHLLAALPEFELHIFQEPTGADFIKIQSN
jgi:hypothetical protein